MAKKVETIALEGATLIGAIGGFIPQVIDLIESDPKAAAAMLNRMDDGIRDWTKTLNGVSVNNAYRAAGSKAVKHFMIKVRDNG